MKKSSVCFTGVMQLASVLDCKQELLDITNNRFMQNHFFFLQISILLDKMFIRVGGMIHPCNPHKNGNTFDNLDFLFIQIKT